MFKIQEYVKKILVYWKLERKQRIHYLYSRHATKDVQQLCIIFRYFFYFYNIRLYFDCNLTRTNFQLLILVGYTTRAL